MNRHMHRRLIALLFIISIAVAGCGEQSSEKESYHGSVSEDDKIEATTDKTVDSVKNNESSDKAAGGFNWKELLTKGEVSSILGEPVGNAEYRETKNPLGQRIIYWPVANDMKLSYVELSLSTTDGIKQSLRESGYDAKKQFELEKGIQKNLEKIDGIGDEAYWDSKTPLISGLHVLKGDSYFTVIVNTKDKASQLKAEKEQALKVLDRLP
ncbi:MAG: hypothetical protein HY779_00720 [Rubrobacteridae bacterium]|nr:hypothetical protein [Rubrobacteridae bacterium]